MGGLFSKPKVPKVPPPQLVQLGETTQFQGGPMSRLRKKISSAYGKQSTMLTGGAGVQSPTNPGKTLLGS